MAGTFEVMAPIFYEFNNCKHLTIMDVIVAFSTI